MKDRLLRPSSVVVSSGPRVTQSRPGIECRSPLLVMFLMLVVVILLCLRVRSISVATLNCNHGRDFLTAKLHDQEARLLRSPERGAVRFGGRGQARLSQARGQISSGQESGRPHAEEKFKELGEAYDVLMDADKRAAYDRFGHAAFAQGTAGPGGGFHDPFDIFREVFGGAAGRAEFSKRFWRWWRSGDDRSRRPPARFRSALRHADHARRSCFRRGEGDRGSQARYLCKVHGQGAEPGSRAVHCPTCGGRGQVISSRGFFQVSQTCPRCRGAGQIIEKPCHVCDGEGRVEKDSRIKMKIPPALPMARVSARRATARPASAAAQPAIFTSSSTSRSTQSSSAKTTISFAKCRSPSPSPRSVAKWRCRLSGQGEPESAGRNPERSGLQAARQRHQQRQRTRSRRSPRPPLGGGADDLNSEQRQKLEEFSAFCGEENTPLHKSFFDRAKEFFR